jgi:hypothetical protein
MGPRSTLTGEDSPGRLVVLLNALDGVVISSVERVILHLVGRIRGATVESIAVVITCVRQTR